MQFSTEERYNYPGMGTMKTGNYTEETGRDRRKYPRLKPSEVPGLKSAELSQGAEIEIVNISRGGMLLETGTCLGPEFKIILKVVTDKGPLRIDGVVLRSTIYSLKGRPLYRSAVKFKQPFELLDESMILEPEKTNDETLSQQQSEADNDEIKTPAILTIMQSDEGGFQLTEQFSLNNW